MTADLLTSFWGAFFAVSMLKLSEIVWKRYLEPRINNWLDHGEKHIKKVRTKVKVVGEGIGGRR